jgi:DNA-binding IclR family transcriptional regulator
MLADDKSILLEVCQSPLPIRAGAPAGTRADLHCSATGKVFLAWNMADGLDAFFERAQPVARTSRTITSADRMAKELALIRKRGYALDEEEFFDGIRCIAVPVMNSHGHTHLATRITARHRLTRSEHSDVPNAQVRRRRALRRHRLPPERQEGTQARQPAEPQEPNETPKGER